MIKASQDPIKSRSNQRNIHKCFFCMSSQRAVDPVLGVILLHAVHAVCQLGSSPSDTLGIGSVQYSNNLRTQRVKCL